MSGAMSRRDAIAVGGECQYFLKSFSSVGGQDTTAGGRAPFVVRMSCGFAAAHGGKALPYVGAYQNLQKVAGAGKPEAFRTVRRQSR
jgi:hypothetical protein